MTTYKRLSFTNEEEKKLIDVIKEHPALWDPNSVEYGNVSLRKHYWKSISQQMHKNASECRRKWRFVRDYYVLKRKRVPTSIPDSKYANLSFLDKIMRPKFMKADEILDYENDDSPMGEILEEHLLEEEHSDMAIGSTTNDRNRRQNELVAQNETSRSSETDNASQYLSEEKYIVEANETELPQTQQSHYIDENTSDKYKIINTARDGEEETWEEVQPIVGPTSRTAQEKDIDLFFQSMASTVKTFPSHLVAIAKMKVFSAINSLEMRLYQE